MLCPGRWEVMRTESDDTAITETRLKLLQGMPVFGGLRADVLEYVLLSASIVCVPKGEFFFYEGDEGDCAYVLEQGRAMFWKDYEGEKYPMRVLGEGECFGEMAMIGLYPRSGSTQALEDCRAIKITYELLYTMLHRDHEQCVMILMNMARDLSRRLRDVDNLLLLERVGKQPQWPPGPRGERDRWMPI